MHCHQLCVALVSVSTGIVCIGGPHRLGLFTYIMLPVVFICHLENLCVFHHTKINVIVMS